MTDLEGLRAKLLMQLYGVLEAKPGASKRLMELCRAYESLARATRRGVPPGAIDARNLARAAGPSAISGTHTGGRRRGRPPQLPSCGRSANGHR
jgi:hypothetical protein